MFGNNKIFAMDISDESLKFVQYFKDDDGVHIGKFGEKHILKRIIENGEITDVYALREILKALKKEYKIGKAKIALHVREGETFESKREKITEDYLALFKYCGIELISIELQIHSLLRATLKKGDQSAHMLLDLGRKNTGIHFVQNGELLASQDVPFTLTQEVHDIAEEIQRHFIYWHTMKDENNVDRPKIEKIILVGGGGDLAQFGEYLSTKMHQEVELANVWQNILSPHTFATRVPEISFEDSLKYAKAIGLMID